MTAPDERRTGALPWSSDAELLDWFVGLPVNRLLGVRTVRLEGDRVVVEVDVTDEHRNPDGNVSGAITAGAVDVAAGIAVTILVGRNSVTGELSLTYLAGVRTGPLRIEVEVLKAGRRTCVPHARLYDASGRLCVVGTGTWVMLDTPFATP